MSAAEVEQVRADHAQRRRPATNEAQAAMTRYAPATIDGILTVRDDLLGRWIEHDKPWGHAMAAELARELNAGLPPVVFTWIYPTTAAVPA